MSSPYIGEIRIFGFNFAPRDWAYCNGQLLQISQYSALFSIIGVAYGGNGTANFALPNLSQRAPMSFGQSPGNSAYVIGEQSGTETETLTLDQLPMHNHALVGGTITPINLTQATPGPSATAMFGTASPNQLYNTAVTAPNVAFAPQALAASTGTSAAHENRQPFLQTNFCICLSGVFPSRS